MVSVEAYLTAKGIPILSTSSGEIKIPCPKCGEDKFSINSETWLGHCFRENHCGFSCGERVIKRLYGDLPDVGTPLPASMVARSEPETLPTVRDIDKWHDALLANNRVMNYLTDEKGWDFGTIDAMQIGLTARFFPTLGLKTRAQALAFPYFTDGVCTFVKYRSLPPKAKANSNSKGHPAPLYNADVLVKDMPYVIVCEGESDVLALMSAPYRESNVIGVPGAGLHKAEWADILALPKKRYLLFDNDAAGDAGVQKFRKQYAPLSFERIALSPFDGKDISDWIIQGEDMDWLTQIQQEHNTQKGPRILCSTLTTNPR